MEAFGIDAWAREGRALMPKLFGELRSERLVELLKALESFQNVGRTEVDLGAFGVDRPNRREASVLEHL